MFYGKIWNLDSSLHVYKKIHKEMSKLKALNNKSHLLNA